MTTRTVKFHYETHGFGFISPDDRSKNVFVNITAVKRSGLSRLAEGQEVRFDTEADARGLKTANLKEV